MPIFNRVSTVTTPATSYDLTTLANVKIELDVSDATQDAKLQSYVSRCSAMVAQFCNRVFVKETVTDEFWPARDPSPRIIPGGLEPLQLTRYPIVTLTSIVENGVALVDGTDFRVDKATGQVIRLDGNGYPKKWPAYAIAVVYDAGFITVPADIEDAVIRMVKTRNFAQGRDTTLMSESIPDVRDARYWVASGSDAGNMTPDVLDILNNYRVPVAA